VGRGRHVSTENILGVAADRNGWRTTKSGLKTDRISLQGSHLRDPLALGFGPTDGKADHRNSDR
jgi:hypothetical protein